MNAFYQHHKHNIAFHYRCLDRWVQYASRKWGAPILKAEEERRDQFVDPYFRHAQPDRIVAILKAREPARLLLSIGKSATEQGHLLYKTRWVDQYNFYIYDRAWRPHVRAHLPLLPLSGPRLLE